MAGVRIRIKPGVSYPEESRPETLTRVAVDEKNRGTSIEFEVDLAPKTLDF